MELPEQQVLLDPMAPQETLDPPDLLAQLDLSGLLDRLAAQEPQD